jgi:hypothetical protein
MPSDADIFGRRWNATEPRADSHGGDEEELECGWTAIVYPDLLSVFLRRLGELGHSGRRDEKKKGCGLAIMTTKHYGRPGARR